jgi:uncharacterized protein (TIGR03435 family)
MAKGGLKVKPAPPQSPPEDADAPDSRDGFYGDIQSRTIDSVTTLSNPRMGTVRQTGDPYQMQRWEAPSISFAGLADLLNHVAPLESPIVDMTGVAGRFQLVLEVSLIPHTAVPDLEALVVRAFNDGLGRLGLRMERRKGPIETIVVDHVESSPAAH